MELKASRVRLYAWCRRNKSNVGAEITTSWMSTHDYNNIRANLNLHYTYAKLSVLERRGDRVKCLVKI